MNHLPVRLMHYDARWRQEFQQTRSSVLQSCEGRVVSVEHVGSTAISGLIARPTIDVLAGVRNPEDAEAAAILIEGLNYGQISSPQWCENGTVLLKPRYRRDNLAPTHCIYLMLINSGPWRSAVKIRDYLQSHPESAIDFERAKVQRWRGGEGDPEQYQADKAIFFSHLLDQINTDDQG